MRVGKLPVSLTEIEEKIFNLLLQVNSTYKLGCTLRVAGGWVRDRLLKDYSHDIDVALEGRTESGSVMTGAVFGSYIVKYQEDHGMETRHVGVIKINPEQSKHLETATTHIFGQEIDIVNLRCEEYAQSRIPVVRPGTPLEDAQRRDLTINALFYNLHTQEVEDFTTGLQDLESRYVRTPLAPQETFCDDPLRLLRCVRFACRFNCEIDQAIIEAARMPSIHEALRLKVSRERVGIEVRKMLSGEQAGRAMETFKLFGVQDCVFQSCRCDKKGNIISHEKVTFGDGEWAVGVHNVKELHNVYASVVPSDQLTENPSGVKPSVGATLAAMLIAKGDLPPVEQGALAAFLTNVTTNGLKYSKRIATITHAIIAAARELAGMWKLGKQVATEAEKDEDKPLRDPLMAAPKFDLTPIEKERGLTYEPEDELPVTQRSLLCDGMQLSRVQYNEEGTIVVLLFWKEALLLANLLVDGTCQAAMQLISHIEADPILSGVPTMEPAIRGDQLQKMLGVKGPAIRPALRHVQRMQYEFPSADVEMIVRYVQKVL
ncbi:CCA tRNA nucleotidyltransferase [Diplonema papillatum]|nr:CCA tRNA nucleotidyltransferase [Diplonema papillatum]